LVISSNFYKSSWDDTLLITLLFVTIRALAKLTNTRSSTEVEYKALVDGTVEVGLRYLLTNLCFSPSSVTTIWCDHLGATYLFVNPIFHARKKHIGVDYHFIRDRVAKKEIQIHFIPSKDQLADVLTKLLPYSAFASLRSKLHVVPPPLA
jgi:hypothetical protein